VVAVVQGNVPRLGLDEFAQKRAVTADHLLETERLSGLVANGEAPAPQAVIWPENSSDRDPSVDLEAREMLDAAAASIQAPILVGAVLDGPHPYQLRNTAIVWTPKQGPTQTYTKRHLVPFGEYIPFRHLVTSLTNQFALVPNDFVPGHRPGVLDVGPVRLADTICFEVADDSVVRQAVTGGGRLIAVQTNNADYESKGDSGHGGEPAQQLAMAQLRAVEHGRAVVVAATSGASAVISPDGRILARTGVFAPVVIDMRVPLRDPLTVADRLGPWPERVAVILASLWLLVLSRPRRRRSAAAGPVNEVDRSPSPALHS
jgi:apolipoprotein N-acyltransferase